MEQLRTAYKSSILKKHQFAVGLTLTVYGFVYQVIGAWVQWNINAYPWSWQVAIARGGEVLVWTLFIISLFALGLGSVMLYIDSVEYHERHPELYEDEIN